MLVLPSMVNLSLLLGFLSVLFRVNPWLTLLLLLGFPSVFFRVRPWLFLILLLLLILPSVANSSAFLSKRLFKIGRIGNGFCYSH